MISSTTHPLFIERIWFFMSCICVDYLSDFMLVIVLLGFNIDYDLMTIRVIVTEEADVVGFL